jgi:hypothetical protein
MSSKRVFYGMLVSVALLVVLCGAMTYLASRMLVKEGNVLLDLKLEKAVLGKQSASLAQAKQDIAKYTELETIAKTVVPQEKDQARTVLELVSLANESGINITSISFPESLLGEAAKKSTKKDSKAPVATVDSNTTQLVALENPKGVYAMEISLESDQTSPITYDQLLDYLKKLEKNRRTAQVVDLAIRPSRENRNLVTFTLILNSYVKP